MASNELFSKFYNSDLTTHEDTPKFRSRILKYTEDVANKNSASIVSARCRSELGITINTSLDFSKLPASTHYKIEEAFSETKISDILDFITIVFDSLQEDAGNDDKMHIATEYKKNVGRILSEESMCYITDENGRIRYYPDEESFKVIKTTLVLLGEQKNLRYKQLFNDVLDDHYRNHNKESPIQGIFSCVEAIVLTIINSKDTIILNKQSIDKVMNLIKSNVKDDISYSAADKENISNDSLNQIFLKWVNMCHKYRHGKSDQTNTDVPMEIFDYIFSTGIVIFRFVLEMAHKYPLN